MMVTAKDLMKIERDIGYKCEASVMVSGMESNQLGIRCAIRVNGISHHIHRILKSETDLEAHFIITEAKKYIDGVLKNDTE